ncbi:hypothetical protein V8D89_014322 [Ganoderma adspersum]
MEEARRLVCDPLVFYALALHSPIGLVMLRSPVNITTQPYVTDALHEHSVPHLKLSLDLCYGLAYTIDFPPQDDVDPDTLACLLWSDPLVPQYVPLAWAQYRRVIRMHALTVLFPPPYPGPDDLCAAASAQAHAPPARHSVPRWPAARSEPFIRAVHAASFDFAGATSALVRALPGPSLRYLYEEWHATRGWRVTDPGTGSESARRTREDQPGPILVELADAVAEMIVQKEDLFVSEAEEESLRRGGGS